MLICNLFFRWLFIICLIIPVLPIEGKEQPFVEEKNVLIACDNSLEMFEWDLEFIRHATQCIEVSACFCGGAIFRRLLDALETRMRECPSLQVYLLASQTVMEKRDIKRVKDLVKAFPEQLHFQYTANVAVLSPDYSTIDNHVKCMIIDETYFSTGGTNLDTLCCEGTFTPERQDRDNALSGLDLAAGSRDQDVVGRGPIAKVLRKGFYKLFALWEDYFTNQEILNKDLDAFETSCHNHYVPLNRALAPYVPAFEKSSEKIRVDHIRAIFSGPMHHPNKITQEYKRLIDNAQKEIIIENLHFHPAKAIFQSLIQATHRDLSIKVITNGVTAIAPAYTEFFSWASRINYFPLFVGKEFHFWEKNAARNAPIKNVNIYEYSVKDIVLHKKMMLIDQKYAVIGSYNLGTKSDKSDYELILVIESAEFGKKVAKIFEKDRSFSQEISVDDALYWYFDPIIGYIAGAQKQFHGYF